MQPSIQTNRFAEQNADLRDQLENLLLRRYCAEMRKGEVPLDDACKITRALCDLRRQDTAAEKNQIAAAKLNCAIDQRPVRNRPETSPPSNPRSNPPPPRTDQLAEFAAAPGDAGDQNERSLWDSREAMAPCIADLYGLGSADLNSRRSRLSQFRRREPTTAVSQSLTRNSQIETGDSVARGSAARAPPPQISQQSLGGTQQSLGDTAVPVKFGWYGRPGRQSRMNLYQYSIFDNCFFDAAKAIECKA